MSEFTALRINRTAPAIPGLASPKYWLRMEQDSEADLVTQGEVAEMLDKLYDLDPCIVVEEEQSDVEQGASEPPPIEELYKTAKEVFGGDLMACAKALAGGYTAIIKVYRSHLDEPYKLVLSVGKAVATVPTLEQRIDTIEVSGSSSIELEYPVAGSIAAGWLGPVISEGLIVVAPLIKRQGNLLYWDTSADGTIRVEYITEYDQVTIEVPGVPNFPGSDAGESQDVKVVAFYHMMVFQGEVNAPDDDNSVNKGDLKQLCGYNKTGQMDIVDDEDEAPLPAPPPESEWGCLKRNENLEDFELFEEICCVRPKSTPNACLQWVSPNRGGKGLSKEIQDRYLAINPLTTFHPVTPEGAEGCGKIFYNLKIPQKNCCSEVTNLVFDLEFCVETIARSSSGVVAVTGDSGKRPLSWKVRGKGFWFDADFTKRETSGMSDSTRIFTDSESCGSAAVYVTDGCSTASYFVKAAEGRWVEVTDQWQNGWPTVFPEHIVDYNPSNSNLDIIYGISSIWKAKAHYDRTVCFTGPSYACCDGEWEEKAKDFDAYPSPFPNWDTDRCTGTGCSGNPCPDGSLGCWSMSCGFIGPDLPINYKQVWKWEC